MPSSLLPSMSRLIRPLRSLANGFGIAWWARIETTGPDCTYWFGPFFSKTSLQSELKIFLDDLSSENPQSLTHTMLRTRRSEPFTISAEG